MYGGKASIWCCLDSKIPTSDFKFKLEKSNSFKFMRWFTAFGFQAVYIKVASGDKKHKKKENQSLGFIDFKIL